MCLQQQIQVSAKGCTRNIQLTSGDHTKVSLLHESTSPFEDAISKLLPRDPFQRSNLHQGSFCKVSRQFHDLIDGSKALQYRIRLEVAGLRDSVSGSAFTSSQRLNDLHARQVALKGGSSVLVERVSFSSHFQPDFYASGTAIQMLAEAPHPSIDRATTYRAIRTLRILPLGTASSRLTTAYFELDALFENCICDPSQNLLVCWSRSTEVNARGELK